MRRLYLQIYLAFIGILLLFGVLASICWWLFGNESEGRQPVEGLAALIGDVLPSVDGASSELQKSVERLAQQFDADITVRAADGALLASTGVVLAAPAADRATSGWGHSRGVGPVLALHLADGRWILAHVKHHRRGLGWLAGLLLLAGVIALGAFPIARRITGRLERLQRRVDALGAGDLSARVQVEGNDEVAVLARTFNRTADRLERLVNAQKSVLAGASHELRSPLTRMRMAVELLPGAERPELRAQLNKDIAELDELIGELLLASRLDTLERPVSDEEVDLLALLAEEAARTGAQVRGEPISIRGELRLLRRLVRNLLENARRYAAGSAVEASLHRMDDDRVCLAVEDAGPGVPHSERERIFEPFYRPPGAKESDGGVGLGLALVRQIARHHGGDVRYIARERGGSRFEVELASTS